MAKRKPCREWMELLIVRDQTELSFSDRENLHAHLAHCSQCMETYERYQHLALQLRTLPSVEPLPDSTPQLIRSGKGAHRERAKLRALPLQPEGPAPFIPAVESKRSIQHIGSLEHALKGAYQSIEEVAADYADVAANAIKGAAEVWLYTYNEDALKRILHVGEGPLLVKEERLVSLHDKDWQPMFYAGPNQRSWRASSTDVPACLPQTPCFPFVWLPLIKGDKQYGVLVLTYPRWCQFFEEDKRVLSMFASQCTAMMENTQMAIALRDAYERLKELDQLKDRFIMTVAHELRTPLTSVQGYIELLENYNDRLEAKERAGFIAKARRGCDELVLMVSNIMDSGRVQVDINEVNLSQVPLATSVAHVLEIMEGVIRRENRHIQVDIADDIVVMADELRLRQIILNLVSNAIKYSHVGSPIEISAWFSNQMATLYIRDYGRGVPPKDQARLFERFVRLERDMNSPVRGAGLGLSISKQLVETMGGHIWVESSGIEGEGSIFAFSLERDQAVRVRVLA